ncbi:NAD-dependent epimerase/dehydratase family protein [Bordetella petrii]|nr:NAD-dependent epimerase/dehydratase family protein [Bordetella petrii]
MPDTVLLTGASGFIGQALLNALSTRNIQVRALDVNPRPGGLTSNVEWLTGSVADSALLERAMDGVTDVVHLAFIMDLDGERPLASAEINLLGTIRLFEAALKQRVRRVVWASSVMVYGPRSHYPPGPIAETAEPMPRTPYGVSKLALEWMARSYRNQGLETVGLRFTTVFGPGRTRRGAAGFCVSLFEQALRGEIEVEQTDRRASMLYIDDAVVACIKALDACRPLHDVYNISSFECSVGDIVHTLQRCAPIRKVTATPGGCSPWPTTMDLKRAHCDLGFQPSYDLENACAAYMAQLENKASSR